MPRTSTADLLTTLLDPDSWRSWNAPPTDPTGDPVYLAQLSDVRAATGLDESVTTGSGRIGDQPVAVVAGDFEFLAGSVGMAAAGRIIAAVERATGLGLPILGLPASGGTRLQEGTPAFLEMAGIAAALRRHTDSGLPYLVYLRHPTTGGVFASWGSLGDITFGEPGALTGFLGPRVYEGLYGHEFPPDVQTSEGLAAAGVIDGVASPGRFRAIAAECVTIWGARPGAEAPLGWEAPGPAVTHLPSARAPEHHEPGADADSWTAISATRGPGRAGARDLLAALDATVELSGTGAGEVAAATVLALGRLGGQGFVIVAQDRVAQQHLAEGDPTAGIGPADLRVARRGMRLAERWGLPFVTVVDTQGAELSAAAEWGALGGEIARCLADLSDLRVPTLSILLGGGAGGGALALLPADRVIAASDSWVTPLPVEGASLIRFRTTDRAAELAAGQQIRAANLAGVGAVDRIVAEPTTDVESWATVVSEELARIVARGVDPAGRRWPARQAEG